MKSPTASPTVVAEADKLQFAPSSPDHPVPRIALLIFLLAGVHYWAARHLGIPLLEEYEKWPLAILIPLLLAALEFFGGKNANAGFLGKLRKALVWLLETPRLILLTALLLLAGSIF